MNFPCSVNFHERETISLTAICSSHTLLMNDASPESNMAMSSGLEQEFNHRVTDLCAGDKKILPELLIVGGLKSLAVEFYFAVTLMNLGGIGDGGGGTNKIDFG